MSRAFSDIAFTPAVRAMQTRMGSRANYAPLDATPDRRDAIGEREAAFIEARDGFYQASVSETGWPYVQFRGGPAGFLKVLDSKTLGYADFRGNVQYISVGNLQGDDRVSIILMDYANQARLKLLGRVKLVNASDNPGLVEQLRMPGYRAAIERAVLITVEGYDWNCPQHITPRFTEQEIAQATAPLHQQLKRAQQELLQLRAASIKAPLHSLGHGPLPLTISALHQLTPRVRAYTLRAANGRPLPAIEAGAHLDVPVHPAGGIEATRRYSLMRAADDAQAWQIAVLREDAGSGGSRSVHADFQLGMTLLCGLPGNDFALHGDADRPALLIAGGIGITPIRTMAMALAEAGRGYALHYAARSRREAAFADELQAAHGLHFTLHAGDEGQRMDVAAVVASAPADAVIYVCGPARLIDAARNAARAVGIANERLRFERFAAAPPQADDRPVTLTLARSGKIIPVAADQSLLDAVQATGIDAPASCRAGTCGTCAVKVLAGTPEHRDSALSEAERERAGLMCLCVSRAQSSDLTIDL
jgi:ferredoxin-NADP reductase/predicted pyridoxine 5'-phosphate oxidase superfamily flavin-nucleotide-binding protein